MPAGQPSGQLDGVGHREGKKGKKPRQNIVKEKQIKIKAKIRPRSLLVIVWKLVGGPKESLLQVSVYLFGFVFHDRIFFSLSWPWTS